MTHKIKLCSVTPKHDLFASLDADWIFLQSAWCEPLHGRTLEVFNDNRAQRYLILDNQHPLTEANTSIGTVHDFSNLINVATRLNANEVIIPDVLHDRRATLDNAYAFFEYGQPKFFNYMFVPQGKDHIEWLECLTGFCGTEMFYSVKTIGVPKWLGALRWKVLASIPKHFEVHFLGCATGWGELEYHPRIRSWDTSLMYAAAQYGYLFSELSRTKKIDLSEDRTAVSNMYMRNIDFARDLLFEEAVRDEP